MRTRLVELIGETEAVRQIGELELEVHAVRAVVDWPVIERPTISVIMPARDEDPADVEMTVLSALRAGADQVVVVDDGSKIGVPVTTEDRILVIRRDQPGGAERARNLGAARASGQVLVFVDSHMRFPDLRSLADACIETNGIVYASVRPIEGTENTGQPGKSWTGYGSVMTLWPDRPVLHHKYDLQRPDQRLTPRNMMIGACYAMRRECFDHLGRWVETERWGYAEQGMCLKALKMGVPILSDRDTVVEHRFRSRFPYTLTWEQVKAAPMAAHYVALESATWIEHLKWFAEHEPAAWPKFRDRLDDDTQFADLEFARVHVAERAVRTDAEVWAIFRSGRGVADQLISRERIADGLERCRRCVHATIETIPPGQVTDPHVPGTGEIVRIAGNAIGWLLKKFGVRAMRCKHCGCFVQLKNLVMDCADFQEKPREV